MADTKTTDETLAGPLDGTEVTRIVQGGVNKKAPFVLSRVRVALSSAQLLALFTSPVTIVPAPGAGKRISVLAVSYTYNFVTTGYNLTGDLGPRLYFGGPGGHQADTGTGTMFTLSSSLVNAANGATFTVSNGTAIADVENQSLVITNDTGDMTAGDGTGSVTVLYATITL
jgi:hypothetical protein